VLPLEHELVRCRAGDRQLAGMQIPVVTIAHQREVRELVRSAVLARDDVMDLQEAR
jgi:hypothetical protein